MPGWTFARRRGARGRTDLKMQTRSLSLGACVALLGLALTWMLFWTAGAHASACAAEVEYTGAANGSWETAGNWSTDKVPTKLQSVCVPAGKGTVTIAAKFTAEAKILTAQSALTIAKEATLAISEKVAPEEPKVNEEHASRFDGLTVDGTLSTAGAWILLSGSVDVEGELLTSSSQPNEVAVRLLTGTLAGNGTIAVSFQNIGGTIEPGGAGVVGELHFTRLSSQGEGGTLVLDLASNSSFDQLSDATSNFFWRGTLRINLLGGYTPTVGTKWEFMSHGPGDPAEFETFIPSTFTARSVPGGIELEALPIPPTVVTEAASTISAAAATLNGTVNPNRKVVESCEFEYGTSTAYNHSAPCSAIASAGSTPVPVDAAVTGLTAGTTYHYRVVAKSEAGTGTGADRTFATPAVEPTPVPPTATTGEASAITQTTATLNASVDPQGAALESCTLEYGSTSVSEHTVPCMAPGAGFAAIAVSAPITNLAPSTSYRFEVLVRNANGSAAGVEVPFTTPAAQTLPAGGELQPPAPLAKGEVLGTIASQPAAAVEQLLLGCSKAQLVLNDVLIHAGHVLLDGSAAKSLDGSKVKIVFDGAKQVASATVGANGLFTATAPLPPARLRDGNSARYLAESGSQRSLNLKLTRRLSLEPPTAAAGTVTLVGQVLPPLTKPVAPISIEQQLECGKTTVVERFTPPASGRFRVSFKAPAGAAAAVYRLASRVTKTAGSKHSFPTYSLPLPVIIG
jgi:hypothetical protein